MTTKPRGWLIALVDCLLKNNFFLRLPLRNHRNNKFKTHQYPSIRVSTSWCPSLIWGELNWTEVSISWCPSLLWRILFTFLCFLEFPNVIPFLYIVKRSIQRWRRWRWAIPIELSKMYGCLILCHHNEFNQK